MTKYRVLVQGGQAADARKHELVEGIQRIAVDQFGQDAASTPVFWRSVDQGFAWTGGNPSTTTVIRCDVPNDIAYDDRVKLLKSLSDLWVEKTGVDSNEVTVTT